MFTATNSYAAEEFNEQQLTVAFLYSFMKFVEWPGVAEKTELTLCVTDKSRFGEELDAVSGQPVQNKTVKIKQIKFGENPHVCQLLFLPHEETPDRIRQWLKNVDDSATLTVSNLNEFLTIGGMITLISDGTHLKFDVNLKRAKQAGLKLSAQLLKIASNVQGM